MLLAHYVSLQDGGFLNSYFGTEHVTYVSHVFNADQIVLAVPRNRRAWRMEVLPPAPTMSVVSI